MADFKPPSFSLGFDFNQTEENKPRSATNHIEVTDEDFETLTVLDSDSQGQDSVPKLKRLRRGSTVQERVPLDSVERKGGGGVWIALWLLMMTVSMSFRR
ncbi:hypothetical protein HanRHA438_Chr04g0162781 [Helianthus annuus]|uniref:Uncharacterized protein n=1 Tax=Helianthus annuus TaxID=4232 RepID=A0A9K3J620_HELAN|nr:hypothetical protein HanXRQr2_Chr04g0152641 [Helianthus annuus]KAJ0925709.1 hypothetical protein HanRHA438_Chr04g0162781 [Helianthus annuus]KAJ0930234.1 hypothetical protein HanPSC8_Chr04g0146971 [Helianthus annuus]